MFWLINILIGLLTKSSPRRPLKNISYSLRKIVWVCEYRDKKNPDIEFSFNDINEAILSNYILPVLDYVNKRYDCSDFYVIQLIKLKFIAQDLLDKYPVINQKLKTCLLNFKFWITDHGNDSMCYYSENHQMCFIACEYLIGQMYPNEIFSIDNKDGLEHQKRALERFNYWMELRNKYSYSEYYSSNYMPITLSALALLYQYANNDEINSKCKKEIHVILKFFATTSFEETFINASGRDYSRNVMNCSYSEPHSKTVINAVFGDTLFALNNFKSSEAIFVACYLKDKSLHISEEIKNLYYADEVITKRKFSLSVSDYKKEGLLNNETKSLMMRLGMGAVTNPEIINLSIKLLKKNKQLYQNDFLAWLRYYYSPLLYKFRLMNKLSSKFNFYNNRMALEESNVYTYRNKYFKMSTNQGYKMNSLGSQQNTMVVTLPRGITIYTTHPLVENNNPKFDYNNTPSYFASYSFAPFAVQEKNVAILLYDIPKRSHSFMYRNNFMGYFFKTLNYTHTFFPTELFDEYSIEGRYAFARVNDSYIALIAKNKLSLRKNSEYVMKTTQGMLKDINKSFDLVQPGHRSYWIYELSSKNIESYDEFKKRIKDNKIIYDGINIEYYSINSYKCLYYQYFYYNYELIDMKYKYDID